ncbi:MAG TPA: class I SAM-dependent methyltransferase [Anaerolineae bacterium]|nr:class I SAM-dependent methyltransferase [Anaerolineae bacterium]
MSDHGNRQKHLNSNPVQRLLLSRFHQIIVDLVQQTQADKILDAGCAEGFVIQHLQHNDIRAVCIGGDFEPEALQWGRDNFIHNAPVANLDIHRLPFPDNHFPLVICLEVLEHLPDSQVGLRELARVSSDYILLSVPHEPFFRGANFLRGKHLTAFGNDPEHLHNYSGCDFRQMVDGVVDVVWHGYSFPWQIALTRKR